MLGGVPARDSGGPPHPRQRPRPECRASTRARRLGGGRSPRSGCRSRARAGVGGAESRSPRGSYLRTGPSGQRQPRRGSQQRQTVWASGRAALSLRGSALARPARTPPPGPQPARGGQTPPPSCLPRARPSRTWRSDLLGPALPAPCSLARPTMPLRPGGTVGCDPKPGVQDSQDQGPFRDQTPSSSPPSSSPDVKLNLSL